MTPPALGSHGRRLGALALAALFASLAGCDSSGVYLGSNVKPDAAANRAGARKQKDAGRAELDASARASLEAGGPSQKDAGRAELDASARAPSDAAHSTPDATAACPNGFADCNGDPSDDCEVDLTSDAKHCGSCETLCPTSGFDTFGGKCITSRCALTCEVGMADCDADPSNGCEVFLSFDANNCGACGTKCANCNQGRCN